tara:strand:+ start:2178 stop:3278 length:1101 start_codon:yes stop_codon:yes gene_type:complete
MNKRNENYAFVSFFKIFPAKYGVGEVAFNFFNFWPKKNKRMFYFSNISQNGPKLVSLKIIDNPLFKLLNIPFLFFQVFKYLTQSQKKYLIIEGASFIGFSFIFILLTKIFLKKTIIIYHSHNIEFEVRKFNSNFIIKLFTFIFERYVFQNSRYSTVTSDREKRFVKKFYNCNSYVLKNGITSKKIKYKNILNSFDYIYFNGSYKYWPNKFAIDRIFLKYHTHIIKKYSKLKIVILSEYLPKKYARLKNVIHYKKYLSHSRYINLIKNSKFLCSPLPKAPGTKLKIIEALYYGIPIFGSKESFIGLETNQLKKSFIIYKKNNEINDLLNCIIIYKNLKKNAVQNNKTIKKIYNYENIVKRFYEFVKY